MMNIKDAQSLAMQLFEFGMTPWIAETGDGYIVRILLDGEIINVFRTDLEANKKNWKKVPHDLWIQNIILHLKCCNDATNQNNHKMKNQEKHTIVSPANRTSATGQVFIDVTPQAVYDYLDSLDENDIVQRTKYDLSI